MDDKKYWSEYYSNNQKPTDASSFAVFVQEKLEKGKTLIELGCGNGRDSVYFAGHGVNVIAVDQVDDEIDYLNENYAGDNLCFVCDDFTNLVETADDRIKGNSFDYIYSRFTFHSINEGKEDRTLDWISEHLDGLFFLEARSLKDPMFKKGRKYGNRFFLPVDTDQEELHLVVVDVLCDEAQRIVVGIGIGEHNTVVRHAFADLVGMEEGDRLIMGAADVVAVVGAIVGFDGLGGDLGAITGLDAKLVDNKRLGTAIGGDELGTSVVIDRAAHIGLEKIFARIHADGTEAPQVIVLRLFVFKALFLGRVDLRNDCYHEGIGNLEGSTFGLELGAVLFQLHGS